MGVVSDFVDGIESAVKDFLNDAVTQTLKTTFELLQGGLDTSKADGIGGMFQHLYGRRKHWCNCYLDNN